MLRRYLDPLLAAALFVESQFALWVLPESSSSFHGAKWVNTVAAVLYCLPVALRRRAPFGSLIGLSAVLVVWLPLQYLHAVQPPFEPGIAAVLVLYSAAVSLSGRRAWLAAGCFAVSLAVGDVSALIAGRPFGNVGPAWVLFALAWLLGRGMRQRQLLADAQAERAERAERDREHRAQLAAEAERVRIARELHDVVTHAVSAMVVQAAAEARGLDDGQAATRQVLRDIETSGREALTELRRLLGVLRSTAGEASLAPLPRLGQLDSLLSSSGLPVRLRVEGSVVALPAGVDLSAYRVLQEALTNVRKHATQVSCTEVIVRYAADGLELDVSDDGRAPRSPEQPGSAGPGFGLLGLAERVALHDGQLHSGFRPAGGFTVAARLPYTQDVP